MNIREAYNSWSDQYDGNKNNTRDVEALALQKMVGGLPVQSCLEVGCGTGKNTGWLATKATHVTAVDFSENMLARAKEKITASHVNFVQADITGPWHFAAPASFDLLTFSLVLEHIEDLEAVCAKASQVLVQGGRLYIGELHPFKQYTGTKARFDTPEGRTELTCFTHHLSDFTSAAKQHGLVLEEVQEFFDDDDRTTIPRILALLFRKA